MKILYIHQYYNTPDSGGPLRSYYITSALVKAGHAVEVITSHPSKKYKVQIIEGAKVHFLPVPYNNSFSFGKRIAAFFKFLIKALCISRKINARVVYATSTPLTIGILSLWLKISKKIPYIFEVRDLWPEAPIQMGIIKNSLLKKLLYALEKKIYSEATLIIALSPPIAEIINQKIKEKKTFVFPNMGASKTFPETAIALAKIKYKKNAQLLITYFGAAGIANNLNTIIEAAEELSKKELGEVAFIVAAQGATLQQIKQTASEKGLQNIRFIPYLNRDELTKLLSVTDFSFVSFADFPIFETGSPNKVFDSLGAGVPVISNIKGWWVDIIEKEKAGFHYPKEKPALLAAFLLQFLESPQKLDAFKKNALQISKKMFNRERITTDLVKLIEEKFPA